MALRVLLADESSTIKKVMQLALSDFAVEVKSVPVGLDVLQVTKSFNPDIIFADVLLAKRSGYDVSSELKSDPDTAHIPVVLMWSGFMEIDEAKAQSSRADRRLEKPFDADQLRSIVTDLVKKTISNPISSFISFPTMPEFEETPAEAAAPQVEEAAVESVPVIEVETDSLELVDEEFASVPLTTPKMASEEAEDGGWAHQDLTKFKIQIPVEENDPNDFATKFGIPQDEDLQLEAGGDFEELEFETDSADAEKTRIAPSSAAKMQRPVAEAFMQQIEKSVHDQLAESLSNAQPNIQSKGDLDSNMIEKVIREEAREVIQNICWKLLPEIAERIVREEINKILRETEKSI